MWTAIDFSSFILLFYRFVDVGKYGESHQANQSEHGVASVALVMLQKLVVPLKILNINDRELILLLKEIVLFNPGKWREDRTGGGKKLCLEWHSL